MFPIKNAWLRRAVHFIKKQYEGQQTNKSTRIFIDRKRTEQNNGSSRVILNVSDVQGCLSEHGFQTLHMENLSLEDKINSLAHVTEVVTPIGAGIINLAFAPKLRRLTLFEHQYLGLPVKWFAHFLEQVVHPSIAVSSVKSYVEDTYIDDKHAPYTVDIGNLKRELI
jgi:capsular polysaccharide biosynthesis protein